MSLAALLNKPTQTPENLLLWGFSHARNHQEIVQATKSKKGVSLVEYNLDPINVNGIKSWLFRHQQAHNEFNSALGLAGDDLNVDPFSNEQDLESWLYKHFKEHEAANVALGI